MARILIIDDEQDFRRTVRAFLEADGHDVFEAENGVAGMEEFQNVRPELVVTDILMPHQDGVATIRQIRKIDPEVKIIAISGGGQFAASAFLMIADESGANSSLEKPFRRNRFMAEVNHLLPKSPK